MARLCPPGKFRRALDQLEEDFAEGLETFEGLARTYAKDPDVRAALGMAYLDDERPFEALAHLEWAERKEPTPSVQDALLAAYVALDMPQHVLRLAARSAHLSRARSLEEDADDREDTTAGAGLSVQDRLAFERARTGLIHGDGKAAAAMARLLAKHPDYQPARNMLVTGRLLRGDLEGFAEAASEAFARAPGDPHALLNAARAAFLRGGVEAARGLRDHADALVPDAEWGGDRYLARAGVLALMDDADATEAALSDYHDWVEETGDDAQAELAEAFDDLLERREHDSRAPLVDLHELIVGVVGRWKSEPTEQIIESIEAGLASMPGVLRELPNWIGYQAPAAQRLLAMLLLHDLAPPPPQGSWPAVFEQVGRHGPGTLEGRRALLLLLAESGHIEEGETVVIDGDTDDEGASVLFRHLEISGEAIPTGLPAEDEQRMAAALEDLHGDRTASALAVLSALHERYPDSIPLTHNLALAERLSGGDAAHRGHERLQRLVDQHPDYLFARAELALMAIDADDLEQAESLLALPEGKRRFHALEWGVFAAASGHLALARGDADSAEQFLDGIAQTLGTDAAPYLALDAALDEFYQEHDPEIEMPFDDEADDDADVDDEADDDADVDDETDDDADVDDEADDDADVDDEAELAEVPDFDELAALPMREEDWCIALRPAAFMFGEDPEATLTWLGAVATDEGFVRLVNVELGAYDPERLLALLAQACAGGMVAAEPGLPRRVSMAEADLVAQLAQRTAPLGIEVVQGDTEPAMAALHGLAEALGRGAPAWLADADDEHVEAFCAAAETFYDVMPWRQFPSDRYLAFRVGNGPWRYANVMGQAGEEYGLVVFAGWREAHAVGPDDPADEASGAVRLESVGSLESLSLTPLAALSPLDAGRYLLADLEPDPDGTVPAWLRFQADGLARPEQGPGVYAALIALVAEHAQRTKHRVRRIDATADTPAGPLRVLYPATGSEAGHEPEAPTVRG